MHSKKLDETHQKLKSFLDAGEPWAGIEESRPMARKVRSVFAREICAGRIAYLVNSHAAPSPSLTHRILSAIRRLF